MTRLTAYGSRWALIATYVLLVLTLQPLLLDHAFAADSSHGHSDGDVCAWLDHAASAGLHSVAPPIVLLHMGTSCPSFNTASIHSTARFHDPVRGPPALI